MDEQSASRQSMRFCLQEPRKSHRSNCHYEKRCAGSREHDVVEEPRPGVRLARQQGSAKAITRSRVSSMTTIECKRKRQAPLWLQIITESSSTIHFAFPLSPNQRPPTIPISLSSENDSFRLQRRSYVFRITNIGYSPNLASNLSNMSSSVRTIFAMSLPFQSFEKYF